MSFVAGIASRPSSQIRRKHPAALARPYPPTAPLAPFSRRQPKNSASVSRHAGRVSTHVSLGGAAQLIQTSKDEACVGTCFVSTPVLLLFLSLDRQFGLRTALFSSLGKRRCPFLCPFRLLLEASYVRMKSAAQGGRKPKRQASCTRNDR